MKYNIEDHLLCVPYPYFKYSELRIIHGNKWK